MAARATQDVPAPGPKLQTLIREVREKIRAPLFPGRFAGVTLVHSTKGSALCLATSRRPGM